MDWLPVLTFAVGLAAGVAAAFAFRLVQASNAQSLAAELLRTSEAQHKADMDAMIQYLQSSFGNLSFQALSRANIELVNLAKEQLGSQTQASAMHLDAKKALIDQQLHQMSFQLEEVARLMGQMQAERAQQYGELTHHLRMTGEQTAMLAQTTATLREALANTRVRGQWGERMAEDVLRLVGFEENVNYLKQKAIEGSNARPDFTFFLPKDLKLNMDVKFPLENYLKFLEASSEAEKERLRQAFLRDMRNRIKEVTSRDYINPAQNTVDYVLLFIPNEQIYAFVQEEDSSLLDAALKSKVILCAPMTLFAILVVIRQAVDNFKLERASNEILSLFGTFKKEWGAFLEKMAGVGKKLNAVQEEYEALITKQRRRLEKPLERIEALRTLRGLPLAPDVEEGILGVIEVDVADEVR